METVREIEHESCHDHNGEQQRDVFHLPRQSFDVSGEPNVSNLGERKVNWDRRRGVPIRCQEIPLSVPEGRLSTMRSPRNPG
ncbi:hypothetical protein GCM10018791_10920 [Streptomyces zaomyceticus]|nr:hypothetical protein GCM10018791_10920 [Streptomyces zaomyceticus]